jgi:DNA repair exonuclease SbcCD nuclease subunit
MKIQYCSDLHLELKHNLIFVEQHKWNVTGEILIMAGDILKLYIGNYKLPFFDMLSDSYEKVFWIPGNHEFYYSSDLSILDVPLKEHIRKNVFLLNNVTEIINGTAFIFSTLWSNIEKYPIEIKQSVSDFHTIRYNDDLLTVKEFNRKHQQSLDFIKSEVEKLKEIQKVVVTHHAPSSILNPKEYMNSQINEAFVIDLTNYIEKSGIDYWMYGHIHHNKQNVTIGKTKMITNQMGYYRNGELECKDFNWGSYFEI